MRSSLTTLMLLCVMTGLSACGPSSQVTPPPAGTAAPSGPPGNPLPPLTPLAETPPGPAPVIPKALLDELATLAGTNASAITREDGALVFGLRTDDAVDKALSLYRERMIAQGWAEDLSMSAEGQTRISYKKGDWALALSVNPDADEDDNNRIGVVLSTAR